MSLWFKNRDQLKDFCESLIYLADRAERVAKLTADERAFMREALAWLERSAGVLSDRLSPVMRNERIRAKLLAVRQLCSGESLTLQQAYQLYYYLQQELYDVCLLMTHEEEARAAAVQRSQAASGERPSTNRKKMAYLEAARELLATGGKSRRDVASALAQPATANRFRIPKKVRVKVGRIRQYLKDL